MTKLLTIAAWLAAPVVILAMLVAPLLGVHFCPQEALPVLGAAGSLPFIGPAFRRLLERFQRPHCCDERHVLTKRQVAESFDAVRKADGIISVQRKAGASFRVDLRRQPLGPVEERLSFKAGEEKAVRILPGPGFAEAAAKLGFNVPERWKEKPAKCPFRGCSMPGAEGPGHAHYPPGTNIADAVEKALDIQRPKA